MSQRNEREEIMSRIYFFCCFVFNARFSLAYAPNAFLHYRTYTRQMMTSWDNSNLVKIKFYFNFSIKTIKWQKFCLLLTGIFFFCTIFWQKISSFFFCLYMTLRFYFFINIVRVILFYLERKSFILGSIFWWFLWIEIGR